MLHGYLCISLMEVFGVDLSNWLNIVKFIPIKIISLMIVKKVKGIVNIVRLCISLICIINFCFLKVTEQYHFLARYVHIPYGERICMDLFSEAIFKHFANSEKWKKSYFLCGILWIWQKFVKITKLCFKQFLTFFFTKQFFHQVIVLDRLSRFKRTNKSGIICVMNWLA